MKQRTYTIACGKNNRNVEGDSKLESKFEQYIENRMRQFIQTGKKPINNRFLKIKIEG